MVEVLDCGQLDVTLHGATIKAKQSQETALMFLCSLTPRKSFQFANALSSPTGAHETETVRTTVGLFDSIDTKFILGFRSSSQQSLSKSFNKI